MSSSRWAEAIRRRAGCAAQEPPPTEGRAQRPQSGWAEGQADGGGAPSLSGGRGHSPPPRTGAAGEAEDGNTLLRR